MKSSIRNITALVLSVVTLVSLSGCKKDENADPLLSESKESLVSMIQELNGTLSSTMDTVIEKDERITELETLLRGVEGEKTNKGAIVEMSDGTGRLTFTTADSIITLPTEFAYPGNTQAPNTSSISISQYVTIKPTINWTTRLNATTLELYHTSGIAGNITVGYLDRDARKVTPDTLQEYMSTTLFAEYPPATPVYSSLYLNKEFRGVDAIRPTKIDEEDAVIRCGLLSYGENSIQYFFVYKGEQNSANDEVIISLLNSITVSGQELRANP